MKMVTIWIADGVSWISSPEFADRLIGKYNELW